MLSAFPAVSVGLFFFSNVLTHWQITDLEFILDGP